MKYVFRIVRFLLMVFAILAIGFLYLLYRFLIYPVWNFRLYKPDSPMLWLDISKGWWIETWQLLIGTYIDPEEQNDNDSIKDFVNRFNQDSL